MLRRMIVGGLTLAVGCFACVCVAGEAEQPKLETTTLDLGKGVTLELVKVPAGKFLMGSPESEGEKKIVRFSPNKPDGEVMTWPVRFPNETQHEVTISKPFFMGTHQVTQAQYEAVMGRNPSAFKGKADAGRRPVETVTWNDAAEFCKKLSEMTGRNVRLPTEAEWEYACRAGTTTAFNTGDTISTDQANYNGNFAFGGGERGVFRGETTVIGSFPANAWGLHDMHGNVWEWCADWRGDYPAGPVTDPQGPISGENRVLRGGSWNSTPRTLRSAFRDENEATRWAYGYVGFRVAVD